MADNKISAFAALTGANVAVGDLLPLVDISDTTMAASGTNKSITAAELLLYLRANGMPQVAQLTSQHAISATTPTKVTGLDMTILAGTYWFEYIIIEQSATITVAPQYNFNFTGTTTKARWWFQYADLSATLLAAIGTVAHDVSTSTLGFQMAQAEDDEATTAVGNMHPVATTNPVQTAATDLLVKITGLIVAGTSGNLELWHGSENATATSVEVGSSLVVVRTA